eukprot:TRINITY_DN10368_c0_g1_i1.p2 TRINITY_DN10368_c0_g1~~TRINITY_DN10368_c0_g1_i1.p2  ORF type:complete len:56 (-),score=15.13 TRINITY_DN10368_c0_g1_i1:46-213(-)
MNDILADLGFDVILKLDISASEILKAALECALNQNTGIFVFYFSGHGDAESIKRA